MKKLFYYGTILCILSFILPHVTLAKNSPIILYVVQEHLVINGKSADVFNIIQPDHTQGFIGQKGDFFNVILKNNTTIPISIHWHGLILPNDQDGVPYVTQLPIQPGQSHHYFYKLTQAGTFWMHSHYKFHEQLLMSAPFIINNPEDHSKYKNVIIMLNDFSFKKPEVIFAQLKNHPNNMNMASMSDLNDVQYDAFLANRRTLKNPQIIKVSPGDVIRLRIIDAASATNFWINTGKLTGSAIAIDGEPIEPIKNNQFQLAIAQRIDILVTIPKAGGIFPILAKVEGTTHQAGVILSTKNIKPILPENDSTVAPPLNDNQEKQLHALHPLVLKPVTNTLFYTLGGNMNRYIWTINNQIWPFIKPLKINAGDRVEMVFTNNTNMSHPMHLHGHVFQVSEIDGKTIKNGPLRDTILVLPHSTKKIIFDANNPGIWMLHCHVLYHMHAGMMTTTNYKDYPEPNYYKSLIQGEIQE